MIFKLVADKDFAGHYNRNQFNFQAFCVSCIELKRNGMLVPQYIYTPNLKASKYKKDLNVLKKTRIQ